jgi:hypothetical protein
VRNLYAASAASVSFRHEHDVSDDANRTSAADVGAHGSARENLILVLDGCPNAFCSATDSMT